MPSSIDIEILKTVIYAFTTVLVIALIAFAASVGCANDFLAHRISL